MLNFRIIFFYLVGLITLSNLPSSFAYLSTSEYKGITYFGDRILSKYSQDSHIYVFIGASPLPIAIYLKHVKHADVIQIPSSQFRFASDPIEPAKMKSEFDALKGDPRYPSILDLIRSHLPRAEDLAASGKRIVVIDYAESGESIFSWTSLIQDYFRSSGIPVVGYAFTHPSKELTRDLQASYNASFGVAIEFDPMLEGFELFYLKIKSKFFRLLYSEPSIAFEFNLPRETPFPVLDLRVPVLEKEYIQEVILASVPENSRLLFAHGKPDLEKSVLDFFVSMTRLGQLARKAQSMYQKSGRLLPERFAEFINEKVKKHIEAQKPTLQRFFSDNESVDTRSEELFNKVFPIFVQYYKEEISDYQLWTYFGRISNETLQIVHLKHLSQVPADLKLYLSLISP